jgi:hypothetical protein
MRAFWSDLIPKAGLGGCRGNHLSWTFPKCCDSTLSPALPYKEPVTVDGRDVKTFSAATCVVALLAYNTYSAVHTGRVGWCPL